MKLREHTREIFWKYYQWISQLKYMHFDTEHVEIGPKMAEIAKIAWKVCEIMWNCVNTCVKMCESITYEFLSSSTYFFITNMLKLAQKMAEIVLREICVKLREIV